MWRNARKKIRRAEKVEPMGGSRWTYRNVKYFAEPENGYCKCGSMNYACQLCCALHFLCEKNNNQDQRWLILNILIAVRVATLDHIFLRVLLGSSFMSHLKTKKGKSFSPISANRAFLAVAHCQKLLPFFYSLLLFFESF